MSVNRLVGLKCSHGVSSASVFSKDKGEVILLGRVSFYWIENRTNLIKSGLGLQAVQTLCWFSFLLSCLIVCPFIPLRCSLGRRVHQRCPREGIQDVTAGLDQVEEGESKDKWTGLCAG